VRPRIAVVGVGHMGALHVRKLAELADAGELTLAGVHDLRADRAAEIAQRFSVPVLPGLEDVVKAADAACVAVPCSDHGPVAGELLDAGIDVLLEKPMASTREVARDLIARAERRARILQIGHIERFSATFRRVLPVLRRPRFIEGHRIGPYVGRATDVSVVLDLMIHDLDLIALLSCSELDTVEAVGVSVLSTTEDIANARLRFRNGCVANLTASRVSPEPLRKIRVFQSDAYISIDFGSSKIQVIRREGRPGGDEPPKIYGEELTFDSADALLAQDRAFVAAVRERTQPVVTGQDGYRALDIALRVIESLPAEDELELALGAEGAPADLGVAQVAKATV
jgi:predicted dehydrogenase